VRKRLREREEVIIEKLEKKSDSCVNIYTRFLSSVFKVLFDKKGELHLMIDRR
jgi:hypothetical protein